MLDNHYLRRKPSDGAQLSGFYEGLVYSLMPDNRLVTLAEIKEGILALFKARPREFDGQERPLGVRLGGVMRSIVEKGFGYEVEGVSLEKWVERQRVLR